MDTLKQTIKDSMPLNVNYLLYIYDTAGEILFKNNIGWEKVKMFDTRHKKVCNTFLDWIEKIKYYDKNKKSDIINFIFTEVLQILLKNPNIKQLKT